MRSGERTSPLALLALLIGSLLPCLLALTLVALATRGEDSPSDATPAPAEETVRVPFGGEEPVRTQRAYAGTVRLFIEGSSAERDAFYHFADEQDASTAQLGTDLEIDGQPALDALHLAADPPVFASDHLYAVRYDVGPTSRRLAFRMGGTSDPVEFLTITVVQLP